MSDGKIEARSKGTPQGSPLSPVLSNIILDELDKEFEKRGHKFGNMNDKCPIDDEKAIYLYQKRSS